MIRLTNQIRLICEVSYSVGPTCNTVCLVEHGHLKTFHSLFLKTHVLLPIFGADSQGKIMEDWIMIIIISNGAYFIGFERILLHYRIRRLQL